MTRDAVGGTFSTSLSPFAVQSESNWHDIRVLRDQDLADADGPVLPDLLAVRVRVRVRRGSRWHATVPTGRRKLPTGDWAARLQPAPSEAAWVHCNGARHADHQHPARRPHREPPTTAPPSPPCP